jgi:outer membrane protein OmpA-like peptidoglycan-associated protein
MKTKTNFKAGLHTLRYHNGLVSKSLFFMALILTSQASLQAQDNRPMATSSSQVRGQADGKKVASELEYDTLKFTRPTWWFGAAVGANFNFYRGTTQQLNEDLTVPTAFRQGNGVGLYLAALTEFHRPDSKWGGMLQIGYDGRNGKFNQIVTLCNCPADLSTNLRYITVEPSLRFAPFKSNFYLFGGPRLAFNIAKSFTYQLGVNPAVPDQVPTPEVKGEFSNVNNTLISMQVGAGYDIQLSSDEKQWKTVLSPFVSFQPDFGQDPRSIETWTLTTVRAGAALKFGRGTRITPPAKAAVLPIPDVQFSIKSPENIPVERRVRETFPIRNYVFFDLGSTQIPDRYVLITKAQVKDFKEDRLETFTPKRVSGRAARQMTVYYNVLNILGDRMGRNPGAVVRLTGASMEGEKDGLAMAESVKKYLVDVFGIAPSRINTEGRIKPRIASEQPGATKELKLIREGDRRVSIWSESPAILQQYQTGPNVPLAPVEIDAVEQAPIDSYVTFNVAGAKDAFTSWRLEIRDETGTKQDFGPYLQEKIMIPGKSILGARPKGDYKVVMIGRTKQGTTVRKEATMRMVLWTPPKDEMGQRFSVIYEFNDSESIIAYQKYLTDVVAPKIPNGATVVIHGYTDIIGDAVYNQGLSLARANDVRDILEKSMANANRTDVKFESYGFGEDETLARYENNYPEERFYNRGVTIDIIPKKK